MVRKMIALLTVLACVGGCISVHETKRVCEEQKYAVAEVRVPVQVLRHVVLLKFNDDAGAADIRKIETAFCALPSKMEAIYDFEWGTDVSVENHQQGFTHCFVVTFLSEEDRAVYLPHPANQEFGALLGPHLDQALVIDYWAN